MPEQQPTFDLIYLFNLLLSRWMLLLAGTLGIMILAAVGSFLADETYESSARLMVSSPKFISGLEVFPREMNEPTVGQMAESGVVYEDLIQIMEAFHGALAGVEEEQEALSVAEDIVASGPGGLAGRFGWRETDTKLQAVLSLAPRDIAGFRHLDPGLFELLDTRTLAENLEVKAEIEFEGPNEIQWEPIIELRAATGHPESAAALANTWARLTLEHVREVVELGTRDALNQLGDAYVKAATAVVEVQNRMKQERIEREGALKKERMAGLLRTLYGEEEKNNGASTLGLVARHAAAMSRAKEISDSISNLRERLAAVQIQPEWVESATLEGEWVGFLSSAPGATRMLRTSDIPEDSTRAREVLRSRNTLLHAIESLREYTEESQLPVLTSRLAVAVENLEDLRAERSAVVAAEASGNSGEGALESLDERIRRTKEEIAGLNAGIAVVEEGLRQRELEVTRAEEEWQAFRNEYLRLREQLFTLEEEFVTRSAEAKAVGEQIEETTTEVSRLHREIEEFENRMAELEVELSGGRKALDQVSALYSEVAVAGQTPFVSLKIISAAPVPKTQVSPHRPVIVLVAGLLGFALLSAWIVLRDNLERFREARITA
jgi:capsular polysaccharide biosynthesis protein